jgi:hypothetical protein
MSLLCGNDNAIIFVVGQVGDNIYLGPDAGDQGSTDEYRREWCDCILQDRHVDIRLESLERKIAPAQVPHIGRV